MFRKILLTGVALALLLGVVDARAQDSKEAQNKALANRFGEALNRKDFDAVRELLAHDFVRHSQATPGLEHANRDQFIEYLKADATTFPDEHQALVHVVAEGDLVAIWLVMEATQEGPMGPFPASHKRLRLDCSGIMRFSNGKLAELWITWDNLAALTQLGHFPPAAPKALEKSD